MQLATLKIETKAGVYTLPLVNLDMFRGRLLDPNLIYNPCLQIINEEHSVLSIVWAYVTSITAIRALPVDDKTPKDEVLWTSAA